MQLRARLVAAVVTSITLSLAARVMTGPNERGALPTMLVTALAGLLVGFLLAPPVTARRPITALSFATASTLGAIGFAFTLPGSITRGLDIAGLIGGPIVGGVVADWIVRRMLRPIVAEPIDDPDRRRADRNYVIGWIFLAVVVGVVAAGLVGLVILGPGLGP